MRMPDGSAMLSKARNAVRSVLTSPGPKRPLSFAQVLDKELGQIKRLRTRVPNYKQEFSGDDPFKRAHDAGLVGLALSGGGIRSATFNLGVLQALSKLKMLHCFDYLSTVSGGGYIGTWLAAWIARASKIASVEDSLGSDLPPTDESLRPVLFLRQYSNYLTPRLGVLSADTWTMVSIWLRNTLLNLVILTAAGAAVLILPMLLYYFFDQLHRESRSYLVALGALFLFLISGVLVASNLRWFDNQPVKDSTVEPKWVRRLIVLPTFASAFALCALCWTYFRGGSNATWFAGITSTTLVSVVVGLFFSFYLLSIQVLAGFYECFQANVSRRVAPIERMWDRLRGLFLFFLYPPIAGLVVGGLLVRASARFYASLSDGSGQWLAMSWGTVMFLVIFGVVITVHVGLMGRNLPDDRREWWGRLGSWFFVYAIGYSALLAMSIFSPWVLIIWRPHLIKTITLVLTWAGTTALGILAGRSPLTAAQAQGGRGTNGRLPGFLLKVAPTVFVIGLLFFLSNLLHLTLRHWTVQTPGHYWMQLTEIAHSSSTLVAFVLCVFVALLFSTTVDINEFSMHHFYKNRLVRCYLGASRSGERQPNPTTGFDRNDDLRLSSLARSYDGPFPIMNATLNLVHGQNLAWQQRKAASFFFTPLFCGYEIPAKETQIARRHGRGSESNAFRPTSDYAYPGGGIHAGTAMAISGAAANPNMGFHSSSAMAFLMTVFNVRLGWWLGNPKNQDTWQTPGPTLGLAYLVRELLGLTNEKGGFINLSDGGHFENLGIYELVRRRCHFIVACDAEEDGDLSFDGLGNAVRKCRQDFGVEIDINVHPIGKLAGTNLSQRHCVVGTIKYPDSKTEGKLVYLKASLTGDEPEDVQQYKSSRAEFPHETTADQWFNESQFESYRKLGCHVAEKTFRAALACRAPLENDALKFFSILGQFWYPPSADVDQFFTKHAEAYDSLIERIRRDPKLGAELDSGLFPELGELASGKREELRNAFYFCTSLIQLMENVYLDLKLEENVDHPDNAGWLRVFSNWSQSPIFRLAWSIGRDTYGQTFQAWCERSFNLSDAQRK